MKKPAAPKKAAPKARPPRMVAKVSPLKGTPVAEYIAKVSGWQADAMRRLVDLVARAAPEATVGIKWSQPVFEHHGPMAFIRAAKNHVTFGFWRGGEFADPDGVLEGDGTRMKHVKLTSPELDDKQLTAFVRQALRLNREKGDPTRER